MIQWTDLFPSGIFSRTSKRLGRDLCIRFVPYGIPPRRVSSIRTLFLGTNVINLMKTS